MSKKTEVVVLSGILVLAFLLRLTSFLNVYAIDPSRIVRQDSPTYENPARALLQVGRFSMAPDKPDQPEIVRTPGYPVLIAGVYAIFGESHRALIVCQLLISIAILYLTYVLGRKLWNTKIAILGLLILAFDPVSFLYAQTMLTETLFTFFFLLGALAGLKVLEGNAPTRWTFLLSLALIAATFVRPVTYYIILPILLGLLFLKKYQGYTWKRVSALLLAALLPWVICIGGWQLRNYKITGQPEFSYIQAVNLLLYRGAGVIAARDHISLDEARQKVTQSLPQTKDQSIVQTYDAYKKEGLAILKQYPVLCIKTQIMGMLSMLFGPGGAAFQEFFGLEYKSSPLSDLRRLSPREYAQRWLLTKPYKAFAFFYQIAFVAILYAGILLCVFSIKKEELKSRWLTYAFLAGMVLYLIIVSSGPEAYSRFRIPLMPFLATLAGLGYVSLVKYVRRAYKS